MGEMIPGYSYLKQALEETHCPSQLQKLILDIVECGCPVCIMFAGITKWSEEPVEQVTEEEQSELHELLKGLPFKVVLEGEGNRRDVKNNPGHKGRSGEIGGKRD